jgi:hypothetical protein
VPLVILKMIYSVHTEILLGGRNCAFQGVTPDLFQQLFNVVLGGLFTNDFINLDNNNAVFEHQ